MRTINNRQTLTEATMQAIQRSTLREEKSTKEENKKRLLKIVESYAAEDSISDFIDILLELVAEDSILGVLEYTEEQNL